MTLAPLLNAPIVVQIHAFLALGAIALTIAIFSMRKGSSYHRVMGWIWVVAMGLVAISSFWINDLRVIGPFSPIHLLSVYTLFALVVGVRAARQHNVKAHKRSMQGLVFGGLALAGAFTLLPGRVMFAVVSGG